MYKKINSAYLSAAARTDVSHETLTRLSDKRHRAHTKVRMSANQSNKANRRCKIYFDHTVNSLMHNNCISAKKKFSVLIKLMKTGKCSNIPNIIENGNVISDSQTKVNIFNDFFLQIKPLFQEMKILFLFY